jgi:Glycosyltransferases involved in cell wall biogenesis
MKKALISVVVPIYNTNVYLIRCLDSIINQSYKNMEIILINDGSTDNSKEIIVNYIQKHEKTKFLFIDSCKNLGVGSARNSGIANSSGDYIAFVDSDDWIDSNFYMKILSKMIQNDLDIGIAGMINDYDDRLLASYRYRYPYYNQITSDFALNLLTKSINQDIYITPIVNNKVYKRNLITGNEIDFLCNSYNEDDVFTFQILKRAIRIGVICETYYHYYQREESITHSFSRKHIDDLINAYQYLFKTENKLDILIIKYFERNIAFLLDSLFRMKISSAEQKQYLIYLFNQVQKLYSMEELINYMDINRIKLFFNIVS